MNLLNRSNWKIADMFRTIISNKYFRNKEENPLMSNQIKAVFVLLLLIKKIEFSVSFRRWENRFN